MLVTLLGAIGGCGGERASDAASATEVMKPSPCGDYSQAVADARQTPGDIAAEVFNACGCSFTIRTSAEKAAAIRDEYPKWRRARCSVNCDTPCAAVVQ